MTASVEDRVFLVIDALSSFASSRKPDSEQMEDLSKIRAEIKAMYAAYDDLRTRIAAVQASHHHWDYAGALTCACGEDFGLDNSGWEAAVTDWAQHVADAVIRELGERVISTAVVESLWDIAIYIQRQKWPDPEEETA